MIEDIKTALAVLQKGGVILYPTDTIWGLGCSPSYFFPLFFSLMTRRPPYFILFP